MKKKILKDEIDLLQFFLTVWINKRKVIFFACLALIASFSFQSLYVSHDATYKATTKIKPISTFEETEYSAFNYYIKNASPSALEPANYNNPISFINKVKKDKNYLYNQINTIKIIDKFYLINLFIEKLNQRTFLKSSIKKFNLIEKENFKDSKSYEVEVTKIANLIKIIPVKNDKNEATNWTLISNVDNRINWENFLESLEKSANEEIQVYVNNTFKKLIQDQKQLNQYLIEDIDSEILTATEDYESKMKKKVAFLKEQAQIARQLNLPENDNNVLNINDISYYMRGYKMNDNNVLNINDISYYMRGYKMIEKEIELIENRTNKSAFIEDLYKLEKEKRMIIANKNFDRMELMFKNTPISKIKNFYAGKLVVEGTIYKENKKVSSILIYFMSGMIGVIFSFFYIYISGAIRRHT